LGVFLITFNVVKSDDNPSFCTKLVFLNSAANAAYLTIAPPLRSMATGKKELNILARQKMRQPKQTLTPYRLSF
jgi:hypothetical protein